SDLVRILAPAPIIHPTRHAGSRSTLPGVGVVVGARRCPVGLALTRGLRRLPRLLDQRGRHLVERRVDPPSAGVEPLPPPERRLLLRRGALGLGRGASCRYFPRTRCACAGVHASTICATFASLSGFDTRAATPSIPTDTRPSRPPASRRGTRSSREATSHNRRAS